MSSIVGAQFVMMIMMYFGRFISYYLPIRFFGKTVNSRVDNDLNNQLKSRLDFIEEEKQRKIYSNCNCVALGVFIAMCFMNVPMVNEEFKKFLKEADLVDINYPLSELTILLGFFMDLYFEQLFIKFRKSSGTPFLHLDDEANDEQSCKLLEESLSNEGILIDQSTSQENSTDNQFEHEMESRSQSSEISNNKPKFDHHHQHHNSHHHDSHHDSHHHHFDLNEFNDEINLAFFILIFASSIFLHECIIAVALGINAAKVNKGILFGLAFSATIPVGILLGILIGYTPGVFGKFISAVFQGLATGTFLQVAFYELMPTELQHHQHPDKLLKKISLMFFGFLVMAFVQLISN